MSLGWRAALPAAGIFACISAWALLSLEFQHGQGHAQRPIGAFVMVWLASGAVFWLLARTLIDRTRPAQGSAAASRPRAHAEPPTSPGVWGLVVLLALLSRLVLLYTPLIQEDDPYRYVLDGQVVLAGESPYRLSPQDISQSFHHPLTPELRRNPQARQVLQRVSHPHLKTVYPPVSQGAFAVGAWMGGWDWQGQRRLFAAVDLAVLVLLLLLLRRFRLPSQWCLLWACNPLLLKEVSNSAHVDVLAAFFLLLAVGLAHQAASTRCSGAAGKLPLKGAEYSLAARAGHTLESEFSSQVAVGKGRTALPWAGLAGLALALSVLSKPYTAYLLPAFLIWLARREPHSAVEQAEAARATREPPQAGPLGRLRSARRPSPSQALPASPQRSRLSLAPMWMFLAVFALAALAGLLLMLPSAGGMQAYSTAWRVNAGAFQIIEGLSRIFSPDPVLPRLAAVLLTAGLAIAIPLRSRAASFPSWTSDLLRVLLLALLLLPAVYPWYALPLLALLPLAPGGRNGRAALALCAVIGVYYLHFLPGYREMSTWWINAVTLTEHAFIWLFLLWTPSFKAAQKRLEEKRSEGR